MPEHRKIVLILFLPKNNVDSLTQCSFIENNSSRICEEFKNMKNQKIEELFDYFGNEEEANTEKIPNK